MLSPLQLFATKLALFTTVLAYLAVDFFLWQGPVWHAIHDKAAEPQEAAPLAAKVFGQDISTQRVDEYAKEIAFLAGQDNPEARQRISRVMELVRAELIKVRTIYNDSNLPDTSAAAEQELALLKTHPQFAALLTQAQLTEGDLNNFLQARLKEQALLQRALAPYCKVSEEEVEMQYESLLSELIIPESRQVQHVFLSFQDKEPAAVQAAAEALRSRAQEGESIEQLAKEAGDAPCHLGTIANDARRPLPELPLFGNAAIPAATPTLARSAWGWHLILASDITPARTPSLAECAESIRTALQSAKCEQALSAYLDASIKELFQTKQLHIYER